MNSRFLFTLAVACVFFASCNKDYNPGTIVSTDTSANYTLVGAMAELSPLPKTVTIDAGTGGVFRGNSGTNYIFPPNAFKSASGSVITGAVQLQVTEYLKKTDMMFSGVLPISNGDPLLSGGEINVTASQGGQALKLDPSTTFKANMPMPGTNATGMMLFTGTQPAVGGMVNWVPALDTPAGVAIVGGDTISIISNTLDFANADRFMSNPQYQDFTVTVTATGASFVPDSLMAFALYDDYNGVWPLSHFSGNICHEGHVPNIPVHFVVLGIANGKLYGGIKGATPSNGGNYVINLTKTSPKALKAQIDSL